MEWIVIIFLIFFLVRAYSRIGKIEEKLEELKLFQKTKPDEEEEKIINKSDTTPVPTVIYSREKDSEEEISIKIDGEQKSKDEKSSSFDQNLEFKFGSKIFTAIGVIALIIGAGFFLRFAFEQNLITVEARVILGIIAGVILLILGEYTRKKFASYSQTVTGGGLGLLYLSFYASYNYYNLFSHPVAFAGMIFTTACGIYLALRYDSLPLALFAQIGGFLTPLLLPGNDNNPHRLFSYVILLDIGMLILALKRFWRELIYVSFGGSAILYLIWFTTSNGLGIFGVPFLYATILFFLFLILPLIEFIIKDRKLETGDLALLTLNPALYFGLSYLILQQRYPQWDGFYTSVLGAFYFWLSYTIPQFKKQSSKSISNVFMCISYILLILIVPIQFEKSIITIAWAAEAAFMSFMAIRNRSQFLKILSFLVYEAVFVRLLVFETGLTSGETAFLNGRLLTYILSTCMFAIGLYFYNLMQEKDQEYKTLFSILLLNVYCLLFWLITIEVSDFHEKFWLPIGWSALGLAGGIVALLTRNTLLRIATHAMYIIIAFRLLVFESSINLKTTDPIFNTRVFTFWLCIVSAGFFTTLFKKLARDVTQEENKYVVPVYTISLHILALFIISSEVLDFFTRLNINEQNIYNYENFKSLENIKRASLSITWMVYAVILLVWGIVKKSILSRYLSLILFSIVIFKVFLYDTVGLSNFYRFVSYATLGGILLLTGYLYNNYKSRIVQFIKAED